MKKVTFLTALVISTVFLAGCTGTGNKSISSEKTQTETGTTEKKVTTTDPAIAEIITTNWNAYTNSINTNWAIVTGVIKNTGSTNVKLGDASGSIYSADGKVVGNSTSSIYPRVLAPGEEAYVAVQIMDTVKKSEIADAKLQFSFEETDEDPIKITSLNDAGKKGSYGSYDVTGELENPSDERVEDIRALVLFYDADGKLINAETAYPEPDAIPAKDRVSFKASTSHLTNLVASYKVVGYSTQWGF